MRLSRSIWTALLAPLLFAQTAASVGYIPALAYGPNVWSIIRLASSAATRQSAEIRVYREDGMPLPLEASYSVDPGATVDIRIDPKSAEDQMCWARVVLPDGVTARGFVEILQDNALEDFAREAHDLSGDARWVTLASRVQGKQMYFLNAAAAPTVVTFCASNQAPLSACEKKGVRAARYRVGANQSLAVQVHRLRGKFFITESSAPGAAVLALFDNGPGTKRTFGSNSSVEFGEPLP